MPQQDRRAAAKKMTQTEEQEFYNFYFTGKTKKVFGVTVRQIARCGDNLIGGYIQKRENLIIEYRKTPAWVHEDAKVYGNAVIRGSAQIKDFAIVRGNATVCEAAVVKHSAIVQGDATIRGESRITHSAIVGGSSVIEDSTIRSQVKVQNATVKFCDFKGRALIEGGNYYNKIYNGEYFL